MHCMMLTINNLNDPPVNHVEPGYMLELSVDESVFMAKLMKLFRKSLKSYTMNISLFIL